MGKVFSILSKKDLIQLKEKLTVYDGSARPHVKAAKQKIIDFVLKKKLLDNPELYDAMIVSD